jgi:hypothetical protein
VVEDGLPTVLSDWIPANEQVRQAFQGTLRKKSREKEILLINKTLQEQIKHEKLRKLSFTY